MGGGRVRVQLRAMMSEPERALRVRALLLAMVVCDVLVVAVVAVGLAAGWPIWGVALAVVLPLVEGIVAARAAYVLHRQRTPPTAG